MKKDYTDKEIIHIHIPKTGGTWLNRTLKEHVGKKFLAPPPWHPLRLSSEVHHVWRDSVWVHPTAQMHYDKQHHDIELSPIKTLYTTPRFDDALKISICRNPFDYLVSCYHYQPRDDVSMSLRKYVPGGGPTGYHNVNAHHGISSFEDFIKKFCDPNIQWAYQNSETRYNIFYQMFLAKGRCGVDLIMRNEYLSEATDWLLKGLGHIDESVDIIGRPKVGVGAARKQRDYRSFYTDELREMVQLKCLAELTLFEYDFDGPTNRSHFVDPETLFYHPITTTSCKGMPEEGKRELAKEWDHNRVNKRSIQIADKYKLTQHIWGNIFQFDGGHEKGVGNVGTTRYQAWLARQKSKTPTPAGWMGPPPPTAPDVTLDLDLSQRPTSPQQSRSLLHRPPATQNVTLDLGLKERPVPPRPAGEYFDGTHIYSFTQSKKGEDT